MPMTDVRAILRRFDAPDELRDFELARFEGVRLAGTALGRATYQPGRRWSTHAGHALGLSRCQGEHVALGLSGVAAAAFTDGEVTELHAGDLFHIGPVPHDSWVVGDDPYVSLHFLGADHYATDDH